MDFFIVGLVLVFIWLVYNAVSQNAKLHDYKQDIEELKDMLGDLHQQMLSSNQHLNNQNHHQQQNQREHQHTTNMNNNGAHSPNTEISSASTDITDNLALNNTAINSPISNASHSLSHNVSHASDNYDSFSNIDNSSIEKSSVNNPSAQNSNHSYANGHNITNANFDINYAGTGKNKKYKRKTVIVNKIKQSVANSKQAISTKVRNDAIKHAAEKLSKQPAHNTATQVIKPTIASNSTNNALTDSHNNAQSNVQNNIHNNAQKAAAEFDANIDTSTKTNPNSDHNTNIDTEPSLAELVIAFSERWLNTENIPVKVGMLILIAAVIAFLRYATDMGWIGLSVQLKLIGIAAVAFATLLFALSKRHSKRTFSLVMQGGSIGVILLTIFAAVKMYDMLTVNMGFVSSVCMIVLTALLSLKQDSKLLAIMAVFAGFLAPIWLSDGSGSHVVLFSYYAILNVGIFAITWKKPWHELSILGFISTYIIGSVWGGLNYQPHNFNSTEPFVILFFLFYSYIPLHHALIGNKAFYSATVHQKARDDEKIQANTAVDKDNNNISSADNTNDNSTKDDSFNYDKSSNLLTIDLAKQLVNDLKDYRLYSILLFGTPMMTFFAHAKMLTSDSDLAISCVIMGALYAVVAMLLHKKGTHTSLLTMLKQAYIGLAATLFTLAIPIGLSAKATTTLYALEGAGAVWLGARAQLKERRIFTWLGGAGLQIFAVFAFFSAFDTMKQADSAVFNELYLSCLLLTISAFLCAWFSYKAAKDNIRLTLAQQSKLDKPDNTGIDANEPPAKVLLGNSLLIGFARGYFVWAMLLWLGLNIYEITNFYPYGNSMLAYTLLMFVTGSAGVLSTLYHYTDTYKDGLIANTAIVLLMISGSLMAVLQLILLTKATTMPASIAITAWLSYAIIGRWIWYNSYRPSNKVRKPVFIHLGITLWLLAIATGMSAVSYCLLLNNIALFTQENILKIGWSLAIIFAPWFAVNVADSCRPQQLLWLVTGQRDQLNVSEANSLESSTLENNILENSTLENNTLENKDGKAFNWQNFNWQNLVSQMTACIIAIVFVLLFTLSGNGIKGKIGGVWLPVINNIDLLQIALIAVLGLWLMGNKRYGGHRAPWLGLSKRISTLAIMLIAMISVITLRVVYHNNLNGDAASLSWGWSMFGAGVVQLALTLVWSILGVLAWIIGSNKQSKPIWLLGAVLMTMVLIKLAFVDRHHLGNLFGIGSFFAYGLLCVIVGYFAPIPENLQEPEDDDDFQDSTGSINSIELLSSESDNILSDNTLSNNKLDDKPDSAKPVTSAQSSENL